MIAPAAAYGLPAFTDAQLAAYRQGEAAGRIFVLRFIPKRCAVVVLRDGCLRDAQSARDAGVLPARKFIRLQAYLQTGDFSTTAPADFDLPLGRLVDDPNADLGEFRAMGASKIIAQTMSSALGDAAVQRIVSATLRHRPVALRRVIAADASASEFGNDLNALIPEPPLVQIPRFDGGTDIAYVALGLYLSSSEQIMDQPALVLDAPSKRYLDEFYTAYQKLAGDPESGVIGQLRERLAAARTVEDVARLMFLRRKIPEIARKIVPTQRLAAFGFGLAIAQGAYNAATLQDPKEAYRWMTYVKAYDGLDARSPAIAALRRELDRTTDAQFADQNRIFAALTREALATIGTPP